MVFEKDAKVVPPEAENTYTGTTKPTHPGKYGEHPLGGMVGAAIGATAGAGAAAAAGASTGAALGAVAGPGGVIAGAGIGGVVGALAGKGIAQMVNPTTEDAYWSKNYQTRPYVESNTTYDTYRPAYTHGVDSFSKYEGRSFDDVEADISRDWEASQGDRSLTWDKAKPATRDAYERLCNSCAVDKK